ncbi:HNH endonuclease family protein [Mycobacterium decipiens]|uniref:HNH endonuclease family protein n=1 Tax=Mycobacterium decipiens TaxID=1430326 RepID=UPI001F60074B|nr:HNH endonuclease family protein [Mycobacterium decipiens]
MWPLLIVISVGAGTGVWPIDLGGVLGGLPRELSALSSLPGKLGDLWQSRKSTAVDENIGALLAQLTVVDSLPNVTGYERGCSRSQACSFGPAWSDPSDHSACSTRDRILRVQLTDVVFAADLHECRIESGTLHDLYTGDVVHYSASGGTAVHIDHLFAVHRAWNAGAWHWDQSRRAAFANDPVNLLAVSARANLSKGDAGLDWLPPNQGYRCAYIARYLAVAVVYDLAITISDRDVAQSQCPAGATIASEFAGMPHAVLTGG